MFCLYNLGCTKKPDLKNSTNYLDSLHYMLCGSLVYSNFIEYESSYCILPGNVNTHIQVKITRYFPFIVLLFYFLVSFNSNVNTIMSFILVPRVCTADPPENCHLNVKKLTKIVIFFNKIAIGNFVEKMTVFVFFF